MLTPERQELLTRVGPGTAMGGLLRRYWMPVAGSVEVKPGRAIPVRIMCEDLALFRTLSGVVGLVDARCPHRGASLAHGFADQAALQCPYHGWRFDTTGACRAVASFGKAEQLRGRASIVAYPVRELGGLVFAYLGPAPVPSLPRYDLLTWNGVLRDIGRAVIPCNWLQIMENSVDPVHVEWLHGRHLPAVRAASGDSTPSRRRRSHTEIGFDVTSYGILKRRVLEGGGRDDDDWRVGHPLVFPTTLRVGAHREHCLQIRVPVDDTHTRQFWYSCYQPATGAAPIEQDEVPVYDVPFLDAEGRFIVDFVDGGDIMAWISQGPIADRTRELLSDTDKGIVLFRRLLLDQLARVAAGQDPLGVRRPPGGDAIIELPQEREKYGEEEVFLTDALDATHVRYSPLRDCIRNVLAAGQRCPG